MSQYLENVSDVNLELEDMGDCRVETVLQIEVRLQLSRQVVFRRVPQIEGLLPELFFADLKGLQYCCDIDGVRGYLVLLYGRDQRLEAIDRVRQGRAICFGTVHLLRTDRRKHTQRNRPQFVELRGGGGGLTYLLHRRKQQSDEDRDDCDHHEQLDQRESDERRTRSIVFKVHSDRCVMNAQIAHRRPGRDVLRL
jgi:hypothetical protein